MRWRLSLKAPGSTSDGQGGKLAGTLTEVAKIWGNVIPLSVNRALAFGITMVNKPQEIDMRLEDGITITEDHVLEIVDTGQILYVHSVIDVDKRQNRYRVVTVEKR